MTRAEQVVALRDPAAIAAFFGPSAPMHIYELGDLDPFFWPRTRWHGLSAAGTLRAIVLEYAAPELPCVLALGRDDDGATARLFRAIQTRLPGRYYSHLAPGLADAARGRPREPHGACLKMVLRDPDAVGAVDDDGVEPLGAANLDELLRFYRVAYPENLFDPRMLETGQYFGIRVGPDLAAVAGIHVYAPSRGVAALGNIATAQSHRGRGYGAKATAAACRSLLREVGTVGLNVKAHNGAALALYRRLGFEVVGAYEEWMFGPVGVGAL